MSLTYYVEERGSGPEDACELKPRWKGKLVPDNPEHFAEEAAEYCQSHRDGWEWSWPNTFVVLDDGIEIGRFSVEREYVPEFRATQVKSP